MNKYKHQDGNSKSQVNRQTREELQAEESVLHHEDSLVPQLSGLGSMPNTSVQAQMLSRIPASQIAANPQLMLQMQQQFGNSHVSQVVQMARESSGQTSQQPVIQAKLKIGAPGDKYEQEADRVASEVVQKIHAPEIQQHKKEEILQPKLMVQGKADGEMTVSPDMASSIQAARGGGQPIAKNIRTPMEQAFGADFSEVRIHTDEKSDRLNRSIQAKAFTTGQDVFVQRGEYKPQSREGQELIAHELTHVMQQNGGQVQRLTQQDQLISNSKRQRNLSERMVVESSVDRRLQRSLLVPVSKYKTLIFDGSSQSTMNRFEEYIAEFVGKEYATDVVKHTEMKAIVKCMTEGEEKIKTIQEIKNAAKSAKSSIVDKDVTKATGFEQETFTRAHAVTFGEEGGRGAYGYATKMVKGLEASLRNATSILLTTSTKEKVGKDLSCALTQIVPPPRAEKERRPGLSIMNYASVYRVSHEIYICDIKGTGLMTQFALALKHYGEKERLGYKVNTDLEKEAESLKNNYTRLKSFFAKEKDFQCAETIVFGYANAWSEVDAGQIEVKAKNYGWEGKLYKGSGLATFDSDTKHSYHVEVLSENIKELLSSVEGKNIKSVLVGGSAGSLVKERSARKQGEDQEETLAPYKIYTPQFILTPEGKFIENVLYGLGQADKEVQHIEGSMHTSVVSALVETPEVLNELTEYAVKTVDMEFGYVAKVLTDEGLKDSQGGKREVQFGVACLITDYPRLPSHGDLNKKQDKGPAKATFKRLVENYAKKKK